MLLSLLCGCEKEQQYILGQSHEYVQTIEIIYVSPYQTYVNEAFLQMKAITAVDKAEWESFFYEFSEISCNAYFHDPSWSVCGDVIRIAYEDGSVDVISAYGGMYYSDGNWQYQYPYFDTVAFDVLISSVVWHSGRLMRK